MNLTSLLKLALPPADHASAGVLELKLPFAEIDLRGVVRRINALGTMAWGWSEGSSIPRYVEMALEGASTTRPSEFPFQLGGLLIGVIPDTADEGWMLIGYSQSETGVREAITHRRETSNDIEVESLAANIGETNDLEEAKMAFISTLSHEIRSPLGAITGYAELVERELREYAERRDGELSPLIIEFVRAISERSQAMQKVVGDLFRLSELYNSDLAIDFDPVELHVVLSEAVERSTTSLDRTRVDLNLEFWDASIFIESNTDRLGQVFENVLSNAVKFTESGVITVRTRPEREHVTIEISDSGTGISTEFITQVFDAFSQEDSKRSRLFEGTGMGLALSRRLLNGLGGTIDVESTKNAGSTFRIKLPFVSAMNPNLDVGQKAV